MKTGKKTYLNEIADEQPALYLGLSWVKEFVSNNAKATLSYIQNGYYFVHYENAHPYFEDLVKPTISKMNYCEPYLYLNKVEVCRDHIKIALKI